MPEKQAPRNVFVVLPDGNLGQNPEGSPDETVEHRLQHPDACEGQLVLPPVHVGAELNGGHL